VAKKLSVGLTVETLGGYLREQRDAAGMSLRQLAEQAGVSNPYLSQIERGLRKPSAEVLQQIAKALRISAEQIYVQAGILQPDNDQVRSVELAVLADPVLTARQKQALLAVYQSFRAEAAVAEPGQPEPHETHDRSNDAPAPHQEPRATDQSDDTALVNPTEGN
jgi:transcriptional regulator with XRE-family HTH domain